MAPATWIPPPSSDGPFLFALEFDRLNEPRTSPDWTSASVLAAYLAALLAVLALIGWAVDVPWLRAVVPELVAMNPLTAACILLLALGVSLRARENRGRAARLGADVIAAVVLAIAVGRLATYLMDRGFGLDRLLFAVQLDLERRGGNQMAPNTALVLVLIAGAVLRTDRGRWRRIEERELLAGSALGLSGLVVLGYAYGADAFVGVSGYIPMALNTALCFGLLSGALLGLRPGRGGAALLRGKGAAEASVRRLVPAFLLVLAGAGWLCVSGIRSGLFDAALGTALMVTASGALLTAVVGWHAVLVHRTTRRQAAAESALAHERQRAVAIIEASHDAIIGKSLDGTILSWNAAAQRIYGYASGEVIGRSVNLLSPPERSAELSQILDRVGRGEALEGFETVRVRKDGSRIAVSLTVSPVRDETGAVTAASVLVRDISAQRLQEAEIRELNEELSRRVAELTVVNDELEAFSYSVSHDLRAPLRAIDGFSRILMAEHAAELAPAAQQHLGRVRAGAQRMGQLIDDLLMLARIARHDLEHEAVDLVELANEVVGTLREGEPDRRVEFEAPSSLEVYGDRRLLAMVMENLLGNAWKFTAGREPARIELSAPSTSNGGPLIRIRDNGAGFDMQYAGNLFGAFQRLHQVSEFPGHGIGLATVRRIIHRHGGRIWAEAEVGRGATFFFTLADALNGDVAE